MCQLKAGALFKHKRIKVQELEPLFRLIRAYKNADRKERKENYSLVCTFVRLAYVSQVLLGCRRAAALINNRALKAGLVL